MSRLTVFGHLQNGRVVLPVKLHKMIQDLGLQRFKMVISEDRPKRSNDQNAYWWAVIIPHVLEGFRDSGEGWLSADCKEHNEFVHGFICKRFVPSGQSIVAKDGFQYTERGKTSALNTNEMTDLIEQVRQWSLDIFGIYIPVPEELEDKQEQLQDKVNRNIGNY